MAQAQKQRSRNLTGMKNGFTPEKQNFTQQTRLFSDMVVAGERAKKNRIRSRLKQEEVAKLAGISLGLLSQLENGIAPNGQYLLFVQSAIRRGAVSVAMDALHVIAELDKDQVA